MHRIAIIENRVLNPYSLEGICRGLFSGSAVLQLADGVQSGLAMLKDEQPDLVLIDQALHDGDGLEVLEALPDLKCKKVVFSTSKKSWLRASRLDAKLLLKLKDVGQMALMIQRCLEAHRERQVEDFYRSIHKEGNRLVVDKVILPVGSDVYLVGGAQITRVQVGVRKSVVFLLDGRVLDVNLGAAPLKAMFLGTALLALSKQVWVNPNHVTFFTDAVIQFHDGNEMAISHPMFLRLKQFLDTSHGKT